MVAVRLARQFIVRQDGVDCQMVARKFDTDNKCSSGILGWFEQIIPAKSVPKESVVITQFANREGNWQPIARRRQRASSIRGVSAGWILQMVEVQHQVAGFVESVRGKAGVQEAACSVGRGRAGRVTQDEEKFHRRIILDDRLKLVGLS